MHNVRAIADVLQVREYFERGFYPTGSAVPQNVFSPSVGGYRVVPGLHRNQASLIKAVLAAGSLTLGGITTNNVFQTTMPSRDPTSSPNIIYGFGLPVLDNVLFFGGSNTLWVYQNGAATISNGLHVTWTLSVPTASKRTNVNITWCLIDVIPSRSRWRGQILPGTPPP